MSAVKRQKDLVEQARKEYGLEDELSDLEAAEKAVMLKPSIELEVAEEIMRAIENDEEQYDVWLGFADGSTSKVGALEWGTKVSYLKQLVKDGVLKTAASDEIWDDENYSRISVYKTEIDFNKRDQLQMEINRLAKKVRKSGAVELVVGRVIFNNKTGSVSFNSHSFTIKDSYSRRLLEYMFGVDVGDTVEAPDLYEFVFGEELLAPNDGTDAKEGRNIQMKNLRNKKQYINERVKTEFNTTRELIFSRGQYRRDY